MDGRPYNTLKPDAQLEEQERRYREEMGAAEGASGSGAQAPTQTEGQVP